MTQWEKFVRLVMVSFVAGSAYILSWWLSKGVFEA